MPASASDEKKGLRNIVEQWSFTTLFLFLSVKMLLLICKIFPKSCKDGWRKTTEAHHRTEESKYLGSISNAALKTDAATPRQINEYIIERLHSTFEEIPEMYYGIRWKRFAALRVPTEHIDLMLAQYTEFGELEELVFYPDGCPAGESIIDSRTMQQLLEKIILFFNQAWDLPDKKRSRILYKHLVGWINTQKLPLPKKDIICLATRMLSANWISFEETENQSKSRYVPYYFTNRKSAGMGVLSIRCNVSYASRWADLWFQISHICLDGRISVKILKKVKRNFDPHDPDVLFPESYVSHILPTHHKYPNKEVYNGCDFIDFKNLYERRKELQEEFGRIIPVSLLVWQISQHPFFKDTKFNIPIDIPAQGTKERTVGFVFVKPSFFWKKRNKREAFKEYLDFFNHQVEQIRKRVGPSYMFLQTAGITPHWMIVLILRLIPKALYAFTGTCCVTLLEGCDYVIPPLSDNIEFCIIVSLPLGKERTLGSVGVRASGSVTQETLCAMKDVVL